MPRGRDRQAPVRLLNEYGEPVAPPKRRRSRPARLARAAAILGAAIGIAAAGATAWFLDDAGRTPREWAPYLTRRAEGHRASITEPTALVAAWLIRMDRLDRPDPPDPPAMTGASPDRSGEVRGRLRQAVSQNDLRALVATAEPGDVIELVPGRFTFTDRQISLSRPGTAAAPITLRAARLGATIIEARQAVVFKVTAPFWRIENLTIRGTCGQDNDCEHAIHVTGDARGTVIRNNRVEDMNAAIKINGESGRFPDDGVIDGNTLLMTRPRDTTHPVTPIDLVAASNWRVSANLIADFARTDRSRPSYGAFAKGAGEHTVFERNVILCEWRLRGGDGRVGLSLGGGGTDPALTRDHGRSGFEQAGGVIRDNLIAFCSDAGIYLNRASRSVIEHNTLLDTAGIDVRFPESSADVTANLVDGAIRVRDGGLLRARGNGTGPLLGLFVGHHPVRALFRDPSALDLAWQAEPGTVGVGGGRPDLCGVTRPTLSRPGAFEDWARCRRPAP